MFAWFDNLGQIEMILVLVAAFVLFVWHLDDERLRRWWNRIQRSRGRGR